MKFILISVYLIGSGGYPPAGGIPVWLGEFNTLEDCKEAAKTISPKLREGSWLWCAPKGEEKKSDYRRG